MAMVSFTHHNTEDEEIGVFGAEKYFNREMEEECPKAANIAAPKQHHQQQHKKEEGTDMIRPMKPISTDPHRAPSTRSQSSWNSQSALLQSVKRRKAKRARAKSFLAGLRCKCVCSDKNAIDVVEEQAGEISFRTSTRSGLVNAKPIHKDHHPIKTVTQVPRNPQTDPWTKEEANVLNKESSLADDDQKARKSLEVFGSPVVNKRSKSLNIESRLAELAMEANPRMLEEEIVFAENGAYNNESGSEASSDLFEIESLTSRPNPFLCVQGSEVPSGCVTPTTCYAPSEASIEWSVLTASAVDLTVLSDIEEQRPKTKSSKQIVQKRHPNILLSCKSHKSVRVAEDAYIVSDKANHSPRTRHIARVTRFQAGNKMAGSDSKQEHGLAKHKLNRSRSPRSSHLLYIQ